ncbi:serine/threonine protein phosphatase [Wenzhouxiangella sp. XN79A]|uniref:metallophosphoesterase family protein n=1 Tax=Wenzhouxiangella sp. XN79A TaxID=2724193 RepID=UPI00144AB606|nr:metallophosphoesterase family protein [Wenzhouxiangella sp. XN79A]NKI35110.1 serine/threonine protein phosphatase [Wenzhouxiangella sp. XN79A]
MKRRLAIGDIHGMYAQLECLWKWVAPAATDRVVFLGDYVDRGPGSRAVLEFLLELHRAPDVEARFLLGNHERMMLDARDDARTLDFWLYAGGMETLASYGVGTREAIENGDWVDSIPEAHWRFLEDGCEPCIEDGDLVFVHGGLASHRSIADQDEADLLWRTNHGGPLHPSGKRIFCGHTARHDHVPLVDEGNIVADTFAYGGGPLTCVSIDQRIAHQQFACGRRRRLRWSETFEFDELSVAA